MKELSERLYELRREAKYSQEELAEMLNISRQALSKWETGQANPDINNIMKLSKIYHKSTDYILFGEESQEETIVQEKIVHLEKKGFQKLHDLPKSFRIALAVSMTAVVIAAVPFLMCLFLTFI